MADRHLHKSTINSYQMLVSICSIYMIALIITLSYIKEVRFICGGSQRLPHKKHNRQSKIDHIKQSEFSLLNLKFMLYLFTKYDLYLLHMTMEMD